MDGIVVSAVVNELKKKILGFNINKIYEPEPDEIILIANKNKLLLCANPSCPRMNLTNYSKINPQNAPMFCMILRKHIQNGRIVNIFQPDFERIVVFEIESSNEFGDIFFYKLIIEIMGKHSNIILTNDSDIILGSIKHVPITKSSVRQILPNFKYVMPPNKNKLNPLEISSTQFLDLVENLVDKLFLYKLLNGISPEMAKEIFFRTQTYKKNFCNTFLEIQQDLINNNYVNEIVLDENKKPIALSAIDLKMYSGYEKIKYENISEAIENFYCEKSKINFLKQRTSDLHKVITNNISRCLKKCEIQVKTLEQTQNKDSLKLFGELIMANIYKIPNGSVFFIAKNYYDNNNEIKIELDENLTAVENAQKYFKKYNKQKRTQLAITEQINKNNLELNYFEGILQNLYMCENESDIEEIQQELYQQKIIRKRNCRYKSQKFSPLHFISSDGFHIYVGKNNIQNDFLTLKFARSDDLWLHTKNIPGSHVVIRCERKEIPKRTLIEAANICVLHSKAFSSSNVAVDYTHKKFVKKTSGAKPGMVIYENYKTVYVTPDSNLIKELKKDDEN